MAHYSTIVIGGGTMGCSAAWELGKRGESALVLEQFDILNDKASHGGQTRIIRHPYAEGPEYTPLVLRADDLWVELEQNSKQQIIHRVGGLELAAPGYLHAQAARESAAQFHVPFEWLSPEEIHHRWPTFNIPENWSGGFAPRSGFLDVDVSLSALAQQTRRLGVEIREHQPVESWGASSQGAWVQTSGGRETADTLIITAGAWASPLLAELQLPLTVFRKVLWWLEVADPTQFSPDRFPVFIADSEHGEIYGFPIFGQPGFKTAVHSGGEITTPNTVNRTVDENQKSEILPGARTLFKGITGRVIKSAVCLYTRTPDSHFIVDRHPNWEHVVIGAGFSGHGYKFAPAIGEHLVNLALDRSTQSLPIFAIDRLSALA